MMIRCAGLLWLVLATQAGAIELSLPQIARLTVERNTSPDSYAAPISTFQDGTLDTVTVEGSVARQAWRLEAAGLTPLQVLRPLRSQLEAAGYDVVLECSAAACGGFDFRFATETLPGPNMYVNIRSYQFVTAVQGPLSAPTSVVTVLASTASSSAYVQIIQAISEGEADVPVADATGPVIAAGGNGLVDALLGQGHAVLSGLDANIALSRSRAVAVRDRLIQNFDVPAAQMDAEGMGYLAPVASNLTPEGREANRRVEVVLLTTPG